MYVSIIEAYLTFDIYQSPWLYSSCNIHLRSLYFAMFTKLFIHACTSKTKVMKYLWKEDKFTYKSNNLRCPFPSLLYILQTNKEQNALPNLNFEVIIKLSAK